MAEVVVEEPDGIVREVIFSRVKEETFQDLVTEFRASGPELRLLRQTVRVDEALQLIRHHRSRTQTLIYFYVVDAASRLSGVLQTRALVAAEPEERLSEIMIQRVVAIPDTATVLDAYEFFVLHKFLAFPIIDRERRITGVVDVSLFNEEVFGIPKTESGD